MAPLTLWRFSLPVVSACVLVRGLGWCASLTCQAVGRCMQGGSNDACAAESPLDHFDHARPGGWPPCQRPRTTPARRPPGALPDRSRRTLEERQPALEPTPVERRQAVRPRDRRDDRGGPHLRRRRRVLARTHRVDPDGPPERTGARWRARCPTSTPRPRCRSSTDRPARSDHGTPIRGRASTADGGSRRSMPGRRLPRASTTERDG
jgi:hypothetical protein